MHRSHLFSLRICHALREACIHEPYNARRLLRDLMAGAAVGVVAIPLSIALAIASGVPPQHGLYTAIVAGFLCALTGGSRFSVSGPTAAFVVILHPVAVQYGVAGIAIASLMAGVMLVAMAVLRLGRLIEYIPESVSFGFTVGIAVVIASLQLGDFLGLDVVNAEGFGERMLQLGLALGAVDGATLLVGLLTLAVLIGWQALRTPVPAALPAMLVALLLGWLLNDTTLAVDTIATRFGFVDAQGVYTPGVPRGLPHFIWPWQLPGAQGAASDWSIRDVVGLVPIAAAIALLGAIESLLCAVVLDQKTGKRHSANSELLGQGIGNLVAPFFGGITATAAIARSGVNLRSGAESPLAAMSHALVVLLGVLVLAPLLGFLPMASMAALLLVVAWNIAELPRLRVLLDKSSMTENLVLLSCLGLTVLVDMVTAIAVGVILASLMFVREVAAMTRIVELAGNPRYEGLQPPPGWLALRINGPLFFAAADRIFGELSILAQDKQGLLIWMDSVTVLDAGGLAAMEKLIERCRAAGVRLIFAELGFQPLRTLRRAGVQPLGGTSQFAPTLEAALELSRVEAPAC